MTIQRGERIPGLRIKVAEEKGAGSEVSTEEIFYNKTVVLFGVPGAFTPTCSVKHVPSFLEHAATLRERGVDTIACLAVNDAWVMGAWGVLAGAFPHLTMLADGNGDFSRALGLDIDLSASFLGTRCRRFALIAKRGEVVDIAVEESGKFEVSSAEAVLARLASL